jgi:hypothetical protein
MTPRASSSGWAGPAYLEEGPVDDNGVGREEEDGADIHVAVVGNKREHVPRPALPAETAGKASGHRLEGGRGRSCPRRRSAKHLQCQHAPHTNLCISRSQLRICRVVHAQGGPGHGEELQEGPPEEAELFRCRLGEVRHPNNGICGGERGKNREGRHSDDGVCGGDRRRGRSGSGAETGGM